MENGILLSLDAINNHPAIIVVLFIVAVSVFASLLASITFCIYMIGRTWTPSRIWCLAAVLLSMISTLACTLQYTTDQVVLFWDMQNVTANLSMLMLALYNLEFALIFGSILKTQCYLTKQNIVYYRIGLVVAHFIFCAVNDARPFFQLHGTMLLINLFGFLLWYAFATFWTIIQSSILIKRIEQNRLLIKFEDGHETKKTTRKISRLIAVSLFFMGAALIVYVIAVVFYGDNDEYSLQSNAALQTCANALIGLSFVVDVLVVEESVLLQMNASDAGIIRKLSSIKAVKRSLTSKHIANDTQPTLPKRETIMPKDSAVL